MLGQDNIWLRQLFENLESEGANNLNIEKIAFQVVQMKSLAMQITNQKFMEHDLYLMIFGIKEKSIILTHTMLAIATNIPDLRLVLWSRVKFIFIPPAEGIKPTIRMLMSVVFLHSCMFMKIYLEFSWMYWWFWSCLLWIKLDQSEVKTENLIWTIHLYVIDAVGS